MGEIVNKTIDLSIEKKIRSSFIVECSRNELFKFTRYQSKPEIIKKDAYDNDIYEFLKASPIRTRFNVLRLFKPGEILNSI